MELEFFFDSERGGMLFLGVTDLFALPPPRPPSSEQVVRACGRLAAEVVDGVVGVDGCRRLSTKAAFGSLREAVACVLATGATVTLVLSTVDRHPSVEAIDGGWVAHAVGEWTSLRLADVEPPRREKRGRDGDARDTVVHHRAERGYDLVVRGMALPERLLAPCLSWDSVVSTQTMALRVAKQTLTRADDLFAVTLYRCGVRWCEEALPAAATDLKGVHFHFDVVVPGGGASEFEWIPDFPARIDRAGASHWAAAVMRAHHAVDLGGSRVLRALAQRARVWRAELRGMWRGSPQEVVDALANDAVCDELSSLMDARHLLRCTLRDEALHMTGLAVLRRMQPEQACVDADWRASAVDAYAVCAFRRTVVRAARFATLHRLGCMAHFPERVCEHGVLVGSSDDREMVLPADADAQTITLAVASLLACAAEAVDPLPDEWILAFGQEHRELSTRCDAREVLHPYRVHDVGEGGLVLRADATLATCAASVAVRIDEVPPDDLAWCAPEATRHADLSLAFPELFKRLQARGFSVEACLCEPQARRLAREWSLEQLDGTGNLSSLGLSLLTVLALQWGAGIDARVFASRTGAAVAAYWDGARARHVLFDPARTARNAFDLAPTLSVVAPPAERECPVQRHVVVEIKTGSRWCTARVLDVKPRMHAATVVYLLSGKRVNISLDARNWRVLARDAHSDVDRAIRHLADRERPAVADEPMEPLRGGHR